MITTVTKQQVTIPWELIRQLDLKPGTQLDWSIRSDGSLIVRPVLSRKEQVQRAAGMGKAWLRSGQSPVTDLIEERSTADNEDLANVPT